SQTARLRREGGRVPPGSEGKGPEGCAGSAWRHPSHRKYSTEGRRRLVDVPELPVDRTASHCLRPNPRWLPAEMHRHSRPGGYGEQCSGRFLHEWTTARNCDWCDRKKARKDRNRGHRFRGFLLCELLGSFEEKERNTCDDRVAKRAKCGAFVPARRSNLCTRSPHTVDRANNRGGRSTPSGRQGTAVQSGEFVEHSGEARSRKTEFRLR